MGNVHPQAMVYPAATGNDRSKDVNNEKLLKPTQGQPNSYIYCYYTNPLELTLLLMTSSHVLWCVEFAHGR